MYTPTLLLLDLPPSILCGYDFLSFTTSPQFHGIKDIPPGWHFAFTSETSSFSIRDGFWFYVSSLDDSLLPIVVRKWDPSTNTPKPADAETYRPQLKRLWENKLSPYRQSAQKDAKPIDGYWEGLTSHITQSILKHLTHSVDLDVTSASSAREDRDDIPLKIEGSGLEERNLGILGINLKRTWREGAVGRERTEGARDRSWALGDVVDRWKAKGVEWGDIVLGQMEACFVMILTVANFSCLEEWKRCVELVLTCKKAVSEHQAFFAAFLILLRRQMERCEDVDGGLFDMNDEGGSLLKRWLNVFKRTLSQVFADNEGEDVREEYSELEKTLKRMFGWELGDNFVRRGMLELDDGETVEVSVENMDEEDESGDYAPVVVNIEDTNGN